MLIHGNCIFCAFCIVFDEFLLYNLNDNVLTVRARLALIQTGVHCE
nr:MAG TPA: hypothetical protein [Caudoviricetes sp.]